MDKLEVFDWAVAWGGNGQIWDPTDLSLTLFAEFWRDKMEMKNGKNDAFIRDSVDKNKLFK